MNISQLDTEEQIINIRNTHVILDSDITTLYGVETRDINKAVKNNPNKFPENYIIQLNKREKNELVENFHQFNGLKHSTVNPKALTEKGLFA
ncbi:ORF6N domain-containing protein [Legionella pneumophila serogroup 1]|uniref:ORF6N domain-containing protein n=1 Tax=Fluoribacter dumoffii TaxID=463 RepID=UPI00026C78EC|nr:ORF6N domain-containing protein [Fluoribacter dumoffii]